MSYQYYPQPIQDMPMSMPIYSPYIDIRKEESEKPNYVLGFVIFLMLCFFANKVYENLKTNSATNAATNSATFTLGDSKETGLNDVGGNGFPSEFLDRHKIECPKQTSINRFKYELGDQTNNNTKDKFQYKYTCTKGGELEDAIISKTTPENERGNGDFVYLDRHNIECGTNEVLNSFEYKRQGADKIYYSYNCIKSKKPLSCRQVKTDLSLVVNDDNTKNLKNLNPLCSDNEALQAFKLVRGDNNTKIGYDYKCCKY